MKTSFLIIFTILILFINQVNSDYCGVISYCTKSYHCCNFGGGNERCCLKSISCNDAEKDKNKMAQCIPMSNIFANIGGKK
ncbi:hypothetical protein Mgra_00001080 [Meloidogyne graminicola]|uniref:Uncharacterized protein n=1 Tax=Meloidogyne graminicola TaxID=189291 RepID=A0A8T0A1Y9_9BILA|nr:hypothetical protein Mgra_00001080 [Meloidogyne graminicola]